MTESAASVVIAGGTGGLGQAVTKVFLGSGALVTATYLERYRSELDVLREAVGEFEGALEATETDMTDESSVQRLAEKVIQRRGRIDVWINLVGGYVGGLRVAETDVETFEQMISINLRSVFLGCRAAVGVMMMQNSGRIINVASRAATRGTDGHSAYSASKTGVVRFTQSLAEEVLSYEINVNAVLPAVIDTTANRRVMPDADRTQWVKPEEVADVMLFLASHQARAINGAAIPVGRVGG
jgi:NAD(P)-dependent dehydrogenase (short-subunit alcohol dehydrogenase family)